jgi:phosphate-selective porin
MTVKFIRWGNMTPAIGKTLEEYVGALSRSRTFTSEDQKNWFEEVVKKQWLLHRPPEGIKGVYAFLDGIVVKSILPDETEEVHTFDAPGAVWAKFGPDGKELELGVWHRYETTDALLNAVVSRGDNIISSVIAAEENMKRLTNKNRKNFWPWDLTSDYDLEFFVEM